ncbi:MAG: rhodanese-like domain-containing protein [Flavobacteriales bacterium]|nr:rhodanese-like domain-containing protein [Flavobacteriales bacterium]
MHIEQIYTGCLAQGAYYIESHGEVAIVDPLREIQAYLDLAKQRGAKIKYIFETHFHADFVSGHVTLAEKTGAEIVYGPTAECGFECTVAEDGQRFALGELAIETLHTPGHTMESTSWLLRTAVDKPYALFSGDSLFLGDVGRPDLAQKAVDMTQEDLAGLLFDSTREKIMPLPDDVIVYPGHGAGSACGKNMSSETVGSIGVEKATNYALRADMTRDEFITEVTDGLLPPPKYFPMNVQMNKQGYESYEEVLKRGAHGWAPADFERIADDSGAIVLDVRAEHAFAKGHVPRSIFIGLEGNFAPWTGQLIADVKQPLLLVCKADQLEEAITRLSRVGFDNILGYLEGGMAAWIAKGKEVDTINRISSEDLAKLHGTQDGVRLFDVRTASEHKSERVQGSINEPLDLLSNNTEAFPRDGVFYLHCMRGYRSAIAQSILKSRGIHNGIDVIGGWETLQKTSIDVTEYVCPSTF